MHIVHNYILVTEMHLKILMLYTIFSISLNDAVSTIGATECRMRYIKQEKRRRIFVSYTENHKILNNTDHKEFF